MILIRGVVIFAAVLFGISLLLPAIDGPGFPALSGLDVLRQGASGWSSGVVAWYANPLFVVVLLALWFARFRLALMLGLVASLLAVSSFTAGFAAEATGRSVPAFSYQIGFWLWLLAFDTAVLAALFGIYKVSNAGKSR